MDMEGETYDDDVLELKGAEVPSDIGKLNGEEHLVEGLARCIKGQSRVSNDVLFFLFFSPGHIFGLSFLNNHHNVTCPTEKHVHPPSRSPAFSSFISRFP